MNKLSKIQLSLNKLTGDTFSVNLNIPRQTDFADRNEIVEREFINEEVSKAINGIDDYELRRFRPSSNPATSTIPDNVEYMLYGNEVITATSPIASGPTDGQGSNSLYYNTTTSKYELFINTLPAIGAYLVIKLNGTLLTTGTDYTRSTTELNKIILDTSITVTVGDIIEIHTETTFIDLGFTVDDIELGRKNFEKTFIQLDFFDNDKPTAASRLFTLTLFPDVKDVDYSNISAQKAIFKASSPHSSSTANSEGYYLYYLRSKFTEITSPPVEMYMSATLNNAKTGKSTNFMTKQSATDINDVINNIYTKYIFERTLTGYSYKVAGDNTLDSTSNTLKIKLYPRTII